MKRSKRYKEIKSKIEKREYPLNEAISLLKNNSNSNFDETVEVAMRLGIDPRKSDQLVRGTVLLPHGTGKKRRILVLTSGEHEEEAKDAGADYVGGEDAIKKIENGWLDFDLVIASPEMMPKIGKIGKVLGPKGLMPNPKAGTVTKDIKKGVADARKGKIEFRNDKTANLHIPIGKVSFTQKRIRENFMEVFREVLKLKPASAKGVYIKSMHICSTMGPSIRINPQETRKEIH
jgi:large subunit ribosomal protein L1